jgi:DNA-binding NtrC family response regulator
MEGLTMDRPTILVANAGKDLLSRLRVLMSSPDMKMLGIDSETDVVSLLQEKPPNLVIACSNGGDARSGLELIRQVRQLSKSTPVVFITGQSSERLAIEALRAGADDYFKFPFSDDSLQTSLKRLLCDTEASSTATSSSQVAQAMVGDSRSMQEVKGYITRVAATDSTVLITGETGTGKELAAEMIHLNSRRKKKPLIRVNCSALPDSLVESELFGYDRGAFTGAVATKKGKFEMAGGGSVFLDEIGDMNTYAQAKVLRSIENKEVCRLGGNSEIPVDVRVIAATNRNPEELVSGRKFREDLYYRLNVARLHLPPLREHKQDISLLVDFAIAHLNQRFGRKIQTLSERAMAVLLQYDWPGNVRELLNILEATYINLPREKIDYADLPQLFRKKLEDTLHLPQEERRHIVSALLETRWNKSSAAQKLKWSRMTLYRKITKYNIVEKRHPPR